MIKRIENSSYSMVFEYKFTIPFDNDIDLCISEKVEEFKSELSLILNMKPQKDFEKKEKSEIVRNLKKIMRGK